MADRDVVVMAASAGGVEALSTVLGHITSDYRGAIFVVLHLPEGSGGALATILGRACPLPVALAADGAHIHGGRVYVCRADHHLLLGDGVVIS